MAGFLEAQSSVKFTLADWMGKHNKEEKNIFEKHCTHGTET
jgi:hypothetical protein